MKKGWKYVKLGEVATFISGYTPHKDELLPNGKFPYFKVSDMNTIGNEIFLSKTELYVNSPKKIYPKDAIVFPKNGGAIYTHKLRFLSQDSVIDLNSEAVKVNEDTCLKEYLISLFSFIDLSIFDNGGGLPSINIKKMSNYSIPLPPLPEQEEIVRYLDEAFTKIDAMKEKAEEALEEAKALFQSALTEMMTPKKGWEEKKLGEVCDVINGLWKGKKEPFVNVGVIRNANFTKQFTLNYDNIEYLDVEQRQYAKRKLCKGDIIVEKSGGSEKQPVGRCVLFLKEDGEFSFSNFTSVLRIKDSSCISYYYLYYCLLFCYKRGDTKKMQNAATGIHNIIFDLFLSQEIPLPPLPEQEAIVARLDAISERVKALEENYSKTVEECDAMKQAMLREVFE